MRERKCSGKVPSGICNLHTSQRLADHSAIGLIGAGCKGSRSVGERMAQVPPSTQLYISLQRHGGLLVTMEKQNYLCDFTLF